MNSPDEIAKEIARLMRDPDALRNERERTPRFGRRGHYDPNQPRVPAGHADGGQWTDDGRNGTTDEQLPVQQARADLLRRPIQKGIEAALALFAAASAFNRPGQQAIVEFRARAFEPDAAERGAR